MNSFVTQKAQPKEDPIFTGLLVQLPEIQAANILDSKIQNCDVIICQDSTVNQLFESDYFNHSIALIVVTDADENVELVHDRIDGIIPSQALESSNISQQVLRACQLRNYKFQSILSSDLPASEAVQNLTNELHYISAGYWEWTRIENKTNLVWSDRTFEILGFTKGEIQPIENIIDYLHPDDVLKYEKKKDFFLINKNILEIKVRLKKKSGNYIWVYIKALGINDTNGKLKKVIGSIADIDYITNQDLAVSKANHQYQEYIENSSSAIIIIYRTEVVYCNKAGKSILHHPCDNPYPISTFLARKEIRKLFKWLRKRKNNQSTKKVKIKNASAKEKQLEISVSQVEYKGKKALMINGTDITKRVTAEKDLLLRTKVEKTLIKFTNALASQPIHTSGEIINRYLRKLASQIQSDRSYVYILDRNGLNLHNEWTEKGVSRYKDTKQVVAVRNCIWYNTLLKKDHSVVISDISTYKTDYPHIISDLEENGVKSVLVFPININNKLAGFIGFDFFSSIHKWSGEFTEVLQLSAQVLANHYERKESITALIQREEQFRSLTEKAHAAIFITNNDRIVYTNPETSRLTGFEKEELIASSISKLFHKSEISSIENSISNILLNPNKSVRKERNILTSTGHYKTIDITSNTIVYNGKTSLISIAFDVTEARKKDEERKELINELIAKNQDLEQFSYIISHNLRSPVSSLKGLVSILDKKNLGDDINYSIIERLETASNRLDNVITDLNQIISVKSKTNQIRQNLNLLDLVNEAIALNSELVQESNAKFTLEIDSAFIFSSVKGYMNSILTNLISNAIKYRKKEVAPNIKINARKLRKNVEISISDNGMGIDLDKFRTKLFKFKQRFHLHIAGQGIGLYLVKTQVEALEGSIKVESKVGVGTTFIIKIRDFASS